MDCFVNLRKQMKNALRLWLMHLCVSGREKRKKCEAHLFERGWNLAYLGFCLPFVKNKCAKLGIAKTGFLNPKKREEK